MGIFSSTDSTEWGQLDGIYIDEVSPPPSVVGVPANIAILVGQFERGAPGIQSVGSVGQLLEDYGNNLAYSGLVALQNKRFGALKIIRAIAADAVAALKTFPSAAPADIITFSALWEGVYGNNIQVKIEAGSLSGKKYTIKDSNAGAVWPQEVYDNVQVANINVNNNPFAKSNLIVATVVASVAEPANCAFTSLLTGSDGNIADSDYQDAIALSEVAGAGNILFLDKNSAVLNGYLKVSMANTTDKMCLVAGANGDSVATAVADVPNCRDSDGRLIYAYPWVNTTIKGISTAVNPCSFYAALLSQIAPNIDPSFAANTQYLPGIESLVNASLTRADYKALMAAGISAFEIDSDIGPKIKSGVTTQIANSAKVMIFRRRMADFLVQSLAKFLKNYQDGVNSAEKRREAAGGIIAFNRRLELDKLVPSDSELQSGRASAVDVKSLNTDDSIANGYFKILFKRRIYSSMRFIVLQAEIGESVVVTEAQ